MVFKKFSCKNFQATYFFQVLDYTQYYLDVTNSRGEVHWAIEYNLTQYYGLREVSANSLEVLADRIRNYNDRGVFSK